MGGDHKCPVCLATFTRPQHVARHMRSHTGDRPYKCQHCGDQFARSDLLSRHVKKCHANEPYTRSPNYRRKGTASASRATTSKQACDQCVQSLLPCDGANPCAKCAQRGCQCTFVKFHRQTAPVGPGHNARPSDSYGHSVASSSLTSDGSRFLLAPAPSSSLSLNDPVFSFLPQSVYNNTQGPSLSLAEPDYRAHLDLTKSTSNEQPFLDLATSSTAPWQAQHQQQHSSANDAINRQYPARYSVGQAGDYYKEASTDLGSDMSSSIPSSASSSNVHLPIPQDVVMQPPQQQFSQQQPFQVDSNRLHSQAQGEGGFSSAFGLMSLDDPAVASGQATDAQPFFWNTLDLMYGSGAQSTLASAKHSYGSRPSLVQRPSTSSGAPNSGSFLSTSSSSSIRTPSASREAETRELREFWKTYLRTPLSGPFMPTPRSEDHQLGGIEGRSPEYPNNNSGYKRQRVSSLPPVRTPGPSVGNENPSHGGETSSMRATLHGNADDLRSYEAAILARKAPFNLHILPRRKQSQSQQNQIQPTQVHDQSQTSLQPKIPQQIWNGKRPGSSASGTSSLAHALGDASSPSPSVSSPSDYSREGSLGSY